MKKIAVLLFVFLANTALANEPYDGIPHRIIDKIKAEDYEGALQVIADNAPPNIKEKSSGINKGEFSSSMHSLGRVKYAELYQTKRFGSRYVKASYLIGMDFKPIVLKLGLYKPNDRWIIIQFEFTSDWDKFMNENSKT